MEGQETEPAVTLRRSAQSNGHSAMDSTSNGLEGCHGERRPCSTPALNPHGRHRNGPDGRGRPRSVNIERKKYSKIQENGGYHPENGELANIIDSRHLTISLDNFHINELQNNGQCVNESDVYFAGRRDVFRPDSLVESKIVSHKGTCRGFKNRVRAGINTFRLQEGVPESPTQKNYCVSEQGKIVVYSTSVAVIRDTHERCKVVKNILQNHMVRFEERDLCMSLDNQRELMLRLHDPRPTLPQVFVDGRALGSLEEVVLLNETGELRTILKNFPKVKLATSCESCGGYRFIPCTVCHGSKKSIHRNNFTEEFCALRCMHCDEHGLVRCPLCLDQQE